MPVVITHFTRHAAVAGAALALSAAAARAQAGAPAAPDAAPLFGAAAPALPVAPPPVYGRGVSLRPFAGALLPTGDERDLLTDAALVGGQLGWQFHPNVALVGSFGWSPSKDRTTALASARTGRRETVDLFQYDIGVEGRVVRAAGASWTVAPYVGAGAGGRTSRYRDLDGADAQTNVLGYGAVGVDVAPRTSPVALRLEARDNVTAFKGLRGELAERKARNDVQLAAGLTYRF